MISELEDEKGTLAGFNVSGDQKQLQSTLINELDLRKQICRELVTSIDHWPTGTIDDRNSHLDAIINLAQRSKAADAELRTRDLQEIDNVGAENRQQYEQLQAQIRLLWIWGVLSRLGVFFGLLLAGVCALALLWPYLTRQKNRTKPNNPTVGPDEHHRIRSDARSDS